MHDNRSFEDHIKIMKNAMQEAKQWLNAKELAEFKWDVNQYCHEAGHYIDNVLGTNGVRYAESSVWTKAMTDDRIVSGDMSVTKYGENSNAEDFAESLAEFVRDYGTFVQKYPNRAKLIEQILK
jgi:hypothetical protein